MSATWRNRIVGAGDEPPDQLLANPMNARIHPTYQQDALSGLLDEVGWVQDVIVNRETGHIIDGHLRVTLALRRGEATIPVKYVELTPEEERLVLATFDPISALAVTDTEQMAALLDGLAVEDDALQGLLDDLAETPGPGAEFASAPAGESENLYTTNTPSPVYRPTGECPPVEELTNTERRDALLHDIERADIPDDVRRFLEYAAERHTVFNYRAIAEFYAHAEPAVQRLMEDSALVIIDFNRAIELGYVRLSERLASILEEALDDDGPE